MNHTFPRRATVAVELLGAAMLLAACGGSADDLDADRTAETTAETTALSTAKDTMAAAAATAETENAARAADGTGPSPTEDVEVPDEADAAAARESAQAVTYAKPKVAALEFTWNVSAAQQKLLSQFGFVIVDKGRLRGAAAYNTFANGVKAYNPATKLAQYVINGELRCNPDIANYVPLVNAANAADFWLRRTNGTKAQWTTNYGACDINLTTAWGKRNGAGQTWPQYKWQQDRNVFFGAAPRMDYVLVDTLFFQGRSTANWRRNGLNESPAIAAIAQSYRAGQAAYFAEVRRTNPALKIIANTDNDLSSAEYVGKLDGAWLEAEMGKSWSTERTKGWAASLTRYRAALRNTRGSKDVVYEAIGGDYDYRAMRYGLGTALMDNGYYMYRGLSTVAAPKWYDEYSAQIGTPTQNPPAGATQNGIWTRTFQNGIVLLNPQGFSATITIPAIYKRIRGSQAPSVNNGAYQNVITLGAKDALVMIRR